MITVTQNSFSKGELDPTLLAREDIEMYSKGARKMRNCFALWTGAVRGAPGLLFADQIMDRTAVPPAPITNYRYINGTMFEYNADLGTIYTLIFRPDTTSTVAIDIYLDRVLVASVAANMYTVAQIEELHFAEGQDRVLILHENVPIRQLVNNGSPASWTLSTYPISTYPVYDYTIKGGTQYRVAGFTFTPSGTTGSVTLTASSAIYTANHVGGLFYGNGGIARITAVASTTSATVSTIEDFSSTAAIPGKESSLNEVMWTSGGGSPAGPNRGWPERGIFYLNRLALGRSLALNNVLAFSTVGVFDDFDDSMDDDIAGFSFTLNYKGNDSLQDFAGNDALIFMGASTVYATNPYTENFLTVGTFYAPPQGGDGSSSVPSISLDNQVFHCTADGTQVIKMAYDPGKAKLASNIASLLSSHLITTITSMAAWLPPNLPAKLIFATQDDGSMLIYSTLQDELISAWSLRTTRGLFRQVFGIKDECNAVVERQVMLASGHSDILSHLYYCDTTMTGFSDITATASLTGGTSTIFQYEDTYLLMANETPYTSVVFNWDVFASADADLEFQYLDYDGQWNFFTPTDGTNGCTQDGAISWTFDDVPGWFPKTIYDTQNNIENQYWIRIRTTAPDLATAPVIDTLQTNLTTVLYFEEFDKDTWMDCQITTSSNSSGDVTGLTELAGQQVFARYQGTTYGPFFVEQDGTTNIVNEYASVDIGLQYKPQLVPMPPLTPTQQGDNLYEMKYIKQIYIDYFESLYLNVAGKDVPVMKLGSYTLNSNVEPQSDFFRINPMGDWEPRQEILITQSVPGPFTIRAIGYNIEV